MPNPKKRQEKAEAAASRKSEAEGARRKAVEDEYWAEGAKKSGKKDQEADKRAAQAAKKAEKARLEAEEEASLPSGKAAKGGVAKGAGKVAARRTNQIDSFLRDNGGNAAHQLSATNIDDALDLLSLDNGTAAGGGGGRGASGTGPDRHPERRFKAAFAKYKNTRLFDLKLERPGLRTQQYEDVMYKEFQKHPDNPFNQVTAVAHNATQEEVKEKMDAHKQSVERRLQT